MFIVLFFFFFFKKKEVIYLVYSHYSFANLLRGKVLIVEISGFYVTYFI